MARLFIALELSARQRKELGEFQKNTKKYLHNVHWVKLENIHLTLKFLGETEENKVTVIKEAMEDVCSDFGPFLVGYGGGGVFPSTRKARVLWVGLQKGEDSVCTLAENLDEKMSGLGYTKEKRAFHPHLTIGRLRNTPPENSVKKFIAQGAEFASSDLIVDNILLFESKLTGTGAIYRPLYKKELL